jgi:hypothetical protein
MILDYLGCDLTVMQFFYSDRGVLIMEFQTQHAFTPTCTVEVGNLHTL